MKRGSASARAAGRQAYDDGLPLQSNPHVITSALTKKWYESWRDGWREREAEELKRQVKAGEVSDVAAATKLAMIGARDK